MFYCVTNAKRCDVNKLWYLVILSLHAFVNLVNVVNGAENRFIGERSEP